MEKKVILTLSDDLLDELTVAIKEAVKEELPKYQNGFRKDWLSTEEVMEMLNISRRTVQNYRDEGKISYTQFAINGKILYPREEIEGFLQAHMVERKQSTLHNTDKLVHKPQNNQ